MKRKLIFVLLAALLLTPWPVAYAYDDVIVGRNQIQIKAAAPTATPILNVFGKAVGNVTRGDLFYIDTGDITNDISVTLHITNTDELIKHYRYMNLNIGVYAQTYNGRWQKVATGEGEMLPDIYITMSNGHVSFTLTGHARYKITVDSGCFYCYGTGNGEIAVSPAFYLTAG
jgi:hypothetical protein